VAQDSGQALLAIIEDILDLSKIEARKIAFENLNFSLHRVLENSMETLRTRALAKGLAFDWQVAADTPDLLRGDPQRLRQILGNLVSNAVKFTDRGRVSLEVSLEAQDQNRITLHFSVTDTGIGIPSEKVSSLFSPFVQADSSTTRKYGGTGLGLAICKQLVGMMEGRIGLESREGEGSVFWFTAVFGAPVGTAPATAMESSLLNPAAPAVGAGRSTAQVRVLVADDDPTNQIVMLALLDQLGYQSNAVNNGAEAVEALCQAAYDVVLMDWQMPVMHGTEATRRIRESGHSRVPIVAVTARAMSGDREQCLLAGADDYLAKPVKLPQLAEVIAKWTAVPEPADTVPGAGVFDQETLLDRLMQDKELAAKVMNRFLNDCPSQLENLRRRLDEADGPGAGLQAHTLQGGAATVSANGLRAIALAIEEAGLAGRLDRVGELLPRAAEEFNRFKQTVESLEWV
jgi:CheY-like chemotaxis protein/HPt (histidine-containing phosphotransfer) domain-containing protein